MRSEGFYVNEKNPTTPAGIEPSKTLLRQSIISNTTAVQTFALADWHVFLVHYEAV